jgi:prolyl 4-hydroxylase
VFWVDTYKEEHAMGQVNPGQTYNLNSFLGHSFRIRNAQQLLLSEHTVPRGKGEAAPDGGFPFNVTGCSDVEDPNFNADGSSLPVFSVNDGFMSNHGLTRASPDTTAVLKAAAPGCAGVDGWLSEELPVAGYHVLCVRKQAAAAGGGLDVTAFKYGHGGAVSEAIYTDEDLGDGMSSIRQAVERQVEMSVTDEWHRQARMRVKYVPKQWVMHQAATGEEVSSLDDFNGLVLVFEGGNFVYPGVRIGFERSIPLPDRTITMVTISLRPLVFSIENFLDDSECDDIISSSDAHMRQSSVTLRDDHHGKNAKEFRTSTTHWLKSRGNAMVENIDARVANFTRVGVGHQEDVQVLRYQHGQRYDTHHDFFNPELYQEESVTRDIEAGFRNRLLTVFWYMSEVTGGYTAFPTAHSDYHIATDPDPPCSHTLKVHPAKGKVILFYSVLADGSGDKLSDHRACPVVDGEKWAANKWVWTKRRRNDNNEYS